MKRKIFEVHFMNGRGKANLCHGEYSIENTLSIASHLSHSYRYLKYDRVNGRKRINSSISSEKKVIAWVMIVILHRYAPISLRLTFVNGNTSPSYTAIHAIRLRFFSVSFLVRFGLVCICIYFAQRGKSRRKIDR